MSASVEKGISSIKDESIAIRAYLSSDLEVCQEIAGSSKDYAHTLDENADAILVAEMNGRVVGFGFIQVWQWNQIAWLGEIVIGAKWRNAGVGTSLLEQLEVEAKKLGCRATMDQPPSNHPVVPFYLANGYRICGYNDNFYPEAKNPTAIFLCKDL